LVVYFWFIEYSKEVITSRKDEIALIDSLDMGKPIREALADLGDAISACDHFASLAEEQVTYLHFLQFTFLCF